MTTPGGVPNLPQGALTIETLAETLQDMSAVAMKNRAVARFSSIFTGSTGLDPALDVTPFGILTRIWAEVNHSIATADPDDITGPEDIPPLLLKFIEDLPWVGEFVDLLQAILGNYDGDDETLLAIQAIFAPLQKLAQLVAGIDVGFPTLEEIAEGWEGLLLGGGSVDWGQLYEELTGGEGGLAELSDLLSGGLFGPIKPGRITFVPIGALGNSNPNLLDNPGFDGDVSMELGDGWLHDTTVGHSSTGSAKHAADGLPHAQYSDPATEVDPTVPITVGIWTRYRGITATPGANAISLSINNFVDGNYLNTTLVQGILSPSGDSSNPGHNDFVLLTADYTPPAGVNQIKLLGLITGDATAGNVWFDDAFVEHQRDTMPFDFVKDLPLLRDILGGADGADFDQIIARLQHLATNGTFDASNLWNIANIPQMAADRIANLPNLFDAMDEYGDLFDSTVVPAIVEPVQTAATKLKGFISRFFGGGPKNVVSQDQVAAASGAAPLDAAKTIPLEYMHPSLIGSVLGVSYVELNLGGNQSIPNTTETKLTGLTQTGPATVTFSSSNSVFQLPYDGFWELEIVPLWDTGSTGRRECALKRSTTVVKADGKSAADFSTYAVRNDVKTRVQATTTDLFSVWVAHTQGSALNVLAAGTYIRATFIGTTATPVSTTFDAKGGGSSGSGSSRSWSHVFGANANTIVVSISHENTVSSVTVSKGATSYTVPKLSGRTYVGSYFGYDAYHTLAAAILPTGVRGDTWTVTVNFSSSVAASANSLSFNNVSALGNVVTSSGGSSDDPDLFVPSNNSSMVAVGFGGMDVDFSSFNQTQDSNYSFSAFSRWSHLSGHASGGSRFQASGGKWSGKGIELHP